MRITFFTLWKVALLSSGPWNQRQHSGGISKKASVKGGNRQAQRSWTIASVAGSISLFLVLTMYFTALVPDRAFPAQLTQTVLAIQHILNSGVSPENLQLVGDSAGGLLIHEVISHMLHPVEGVPILKISAPLAGAFLMSPWVRLRDTPDQVLKTRVEGSGDIITRRTGLYWAEKVLEGVPASALPYLDANTAPEDWLQGVDGCIKRILISAGGLEVLRDEVIRYSKTVQKHTRNTVKR